MDPTASRAACGAGPEYAGEGIEGRRVARPAWTGVADHEALRRVGSGRVPVPAQRADDQTVRGRAFQDLVLVRAAAGQADQHMEAGRDALQLVAVAEPFDEQVAAPSVLQAA